MGNIQQNIAQIIKNCIDFAQLQIILLKKILKNCNNHIWQKKIYWKQIAEKSLFISFISSFQSYNIFKGSFVLRCLFYLLTILFFPLHRSERRGFFFFLLLLTSLMSFVLLKLCL